MECADEAKRKVLSGLLLLLWLFPRLPWKIFKFGLRGTCIHESMEDAVSKKKAQWC